MTLSSPATAVGIFDRPEQAQEAIHALKEVGFSEEQMGLAAREWATQLQGVRQDTQNVAAEGALVGAIAGGSLGAAAGLLGAILIPGAAPVLAGSALLTALGGGAAGAAGGTLAGPFIALGFSERAAKRKAQYLGQGKTVLLVHTPDRLEEARSIMVEYGAYDDSMDAGP